MHCTSNTITTAIVGFLAAASTVLAAPAPLPQDTTNTEPIPSAAEAPASFASVTAPVQAATSTAATYYAPVATIYPSYTSTYHSKNGAVEFHVPQAIVSRSPGNGGDDLSALLTFTVPEQHKSRSCNLVFDLTAGGSSTYGSMKAQIFSSIAPATKSASTWPSGNLRDQFLGNINVVAGGRATWVSADGGKAASSQGWIPCSEFAGKIYGAEVVPRFDVDYISWLAALDGLKIIVW